MSTITIQDVTSFTAEDDAKVAALMDEAQFDIQSAISKVMTSHCDQLRYQVADFVGQMESNNLKMEKLNDQISAENRKQSNHNGAAGATKSAQDAVDKAQADLNLIAAPDSTALGYSPRGNHSTQEVSAAVTKLNEAKSALNTAKDNEVKYAMDDAAIAASNEMIADCKAQLDKYNNVQANTMTSLQSVQAALANSTGTMSATIKSCTESNSAIIRNLN